MRQRVVIVGAGLGGCVLAHALCATHDVVMVEAGALPGAPQPQVRDLDRPALTEPHLGAGLGGSTQLWHNGLIEIEASVFQAHWPFAKPELAADYEQAFELLCDVPAAQVREAIAELRRRYRTAGMPDGMLPGLFYPRWPLNVWEHFGLAGKVQLVAARVSGFEHDAEGRIRSLRLQGEGAPESLAGDVFILAAGGLSTPLLLQTLAHTLPLPALQQAGCHYEDHPMTFVGEMRLDAPLYRLWNFRARGTGGNLRMPLVIEQDGLHISFQLRPAAAYHRNARRERVGSVLNELRRRPWDPRLHLRLLRHWDDVLDILSFKFGIRIPTSHYTVLMVAQMPTQPERAISASPEEPGVILRRWRLDAAYMDTLRRAIERLFEQLAPLTRSARSFEGWPEDLRSAAHHSGTARLSRSPAEGVCDAQARVHGAPNPYVCDGSLIPASGIANTGLTIAALALRLARHLRASPPPQET